jgi:hypothetical protein
MSVNILFYNEILKNFHEIPKIITKIAKYFKELFNLLELKLSESLSITKIIVLRFNIML